MKFEEIGNKNSEFYNEGSIFCVEWFKKRKKKIKINNYFQTLFYLYIVYKVEQKDKKYDNICLT